MKKIEIWTFPLSSMSLEYFLGFLGFYFFQVFEHKLVSLFENLAINPFYLANELSNININNTKKLCLSPFSSY